MLRGAAKGAGPSRVQVGAGEQKDVGEAASIGSDRGAVDRTQNRWAMGVVRTEYLRYLPTGF